MFSQTFFTQNESTKNKNIYKDKKNDKKNNKKSVSSLTLTHATVFQSGKIWEILGLKLLEIFVLK